MSEHFPTVDTAAVHAAIAARRAERRRFLASAGGLAAAGLGAAALASCGSDSSTTATTATSSSTTSVAATPTEVDVLNFALNLEYLEASYYSYAAYGTGLASTLITGVGVQGTVTGGAQVGFTDTLVAQYAREIAADETAHVAYLRTLLNGSAGTGNIAVAIPTISLDGTSATGPFSVAAQAAGIVASGGTFNPFASDENFLLGAFLFEDVGVSAYKGGATLLTSKTYVEPLAGILATEAYHAGLIRSVLYRKGIESNANLLTQAQGISDARDGLDGSSDDDQGIGDQTTANITPTDGSGIAYSRSPGQVLNIAFLTRAAATKGGFFPSGINGNVNTSAAS